MTRVRAEDLIRAHLSYGLCYAAAHEVEHGVSEQQVESWDDDQPNQKAAEADDEAVLESDDVAEAEHCGSGVELEHHLRLVRDGVPYADEGGGDGLSPGSEGGDGEVVESAEQARDREGFRALAASLAVNQHLGGGGRLGEGILPVHLLHEVLAEGDEEEDAEHSSQQAAEEHVPEAHVQT